MPMTPPRICRCGATVAAGVTCACQVERKAAADQRRPSARARGYDGKWQQATKGYLAKPENRWCACGCGRPADTVDHKIAHKGDRRLFWDRSNWRAVNGRCNSRKAAASEGGFGNPTKAAKAKHASGLTSEKRDTVLMG